MKTRFLGTLLPSLAVLLPLGLWSCSGGSSSSVKTSISCAKQAALCLVGCNLGCSVVGCSINQIAQNQPIILSFNQDVLPESVNADTIRIRTTNGIEPVGSFLVQNNLVFFVPEVITLKGPDGNFFTKFGFDLGVKYVMTIPGKGDALQTLLSKGGNPLLETFTCTLDVNQGPRDFDGKPPTASLVVPQQRENVSLKSIIILEFSELVDTSSLIDKDGNLTGVTYGISQFAGSGACSSKTIPLPGTYTISTNKLDQRTVLTFRPSGELPGDVCVRVSVTSQVRDLANKQARPIVFEFKTESSPKKAITIFEDFSNPSQTMDSLNNGAKWTSAGAVGVSLGGSGRLGEFDIRFGGRDTGRSDLKGRRIYEWDTDNTKIPGTRTLSGQTISVTNGVYEFTSMVVGDKEHLHFVGKSPVTLKVAGQLQVLGALSVSAPAVKTPPYTNMGPILGQVGQPGGPGGSPGGKGGDVPEKKTTTTRDPNGKQGKGVLLPKGHPLASSAAATGGMGSKAHPKDAFQTITYSYVDVISQMLASGGGGGGFYDPTNKGIGGTGGKVVTNINASTGKPKPGDFGPPSVGGKALPLQTILGKPITVSSSDLFLIGGSGGGGGGAHPYGSFSTGAPDWSSGSGGAGGGGTLWIKVGGDIRLQLSGMITADGADGHYNVHKYTGKNFASTPGGGGSGGSILIHTSGRPDLFGKVTALGGKAGIMDGYANNTGFLGLNSLSGAGGPGFLRVETDPKPDYKSFDRFAPVAGPDNVGLLRTIDYDDISIVATNWYDTKQIFPPRFLYYKIQTLVDNNPMTFSDETPTSRRAMSGEAVIILFQGAQLDAKTGKPVPASISKWVEGEIDALNLVGGNAFRILLLLDRSRTSTKANIVIKEMSFTFKA